MKSFHNYTPDEQNNIFDLYKKSYEKSVGNAWGKDKFFDKAEDWDFFGDQTGYVAARLQGSGMYKLAVIGGNPRGILIGLKELSSLNKPTWGMVSNDILPMMIKLGFKPPSSVIMKILLIFIPKEVFGGVNFKINSDGSITLNYEDTGETKKYFVGNQQYFDWLKTQIKDKMNPMKLINILREVILEAKQVGNLYHFTPLENLKDILASRFLVANDENQISTSIRANMNLNNLSKMDNKPVARLMLDGNKISTKYRIRPFSYEEEDLGEEQIVVNGGNFYFLPYLKRIDIFLNGKSKVKIDNIIKILKDSNIKYEIYNSSPESHTPYKQPKDGSPDSINLSKLKNYTEEDMYFPGMKTKIIKIYTHEKNIKYNIISDIKVAVSPQYPDYYIYTGFMKNKKYYDYYNLKNEKINTKLIPLPMYDDIKWRKKWKFVSSLIPYKMNKFSPESTYDAYILIPKKEVDM
jgi:hypothetical protein